MSRAAQEVQRAVDQMRSADDADGTDGTGGTEEVATGADGIVPSGEQEQAAGGGGGDDSMAKKPRAKRAAKPRAARKPRERKPKAPKGPRTVRPGKKGLLLVTTQDLPRVIAGLKLLSAETRDEQEHAAIQHLVERAESRL